MKFLKHGWDKDGRRWHWKLGLLRYPKGVELYLTRVLTHWRWKPWPSASFWKGLDGRPCEWLGIQVRWDLPFRVGATHIYYDGPHCVYQFGPIAFVECWRWCKKCHPEE